MSKLVDTNRYTQAQFVEYIKNNGPDIFALLNNRAIFGGADLQLWVNSAETTPFILIANDELQHINDINDHAEIYPPDIDRGTGLIIVQDRRFKGDKYKFYDMDDTQMINLLERL